MSKTIKQRHLEAIAGCCINDASANHAAQKSEAITDDVSIEFSRWLDAKRTLYAPFVSTQKLFQLFKKETGL